MSKLIRDKMPADKPKEGVPKMTAGGYIKIWRRWLYGEVMQDAYLTQILLWCLLRANWQDSTRDGVTLKRGQFRTSRIRASEELNMSPSRWYRDIGRLKALGCIEIESNSIWTTITVCNYETYQDRTRESEPPLNSDWTADEQLTLIEEEEELKEKQAAAPRTPKFDPLKMSFPQELDTPAFSATWSEWIKSRQDRHLSVREEFLSRQLKFLATLGEAAALQSIADTIRNDWKGLFPPKANGHKKGSVKDTAQSAYEWANQGDNNYEPH